MDIKDCTQTKDGTPVRIYATDTGGSYPIHGAIYDAKKDQWYINTWTENGRNCLHASHTPKDLDLSDWKDEIPWNCLRPEIKWVARDREKYWYGYDEYPSLETTTWESKEIGGEYSLEAINMPNGPHDWTQAIAKRPE